MLGLQALTGYIYGLRMDLIGQSDGVGLHRAVGYNGGNNDWGLRVEIE
jgi:hypothetical protein